MPLVILIGASGSGKTTIAKAIEGRYPDRIRVFYFDRIGVPSAEEMIAEYGSGEGWQRAKTIDWMAKLAEISRSGQNVLFEGQTRLSFIEEGAWAAGGTSYVPVLVDCDDETRTKRLQFERNQPELANADMMNWARYLRVEAEKNCCAILDTSALSLEESVERIVSVFRTI